MRKPIRFSIKNSNEFLIPENYQGDYFQMREEVKRQNSLNPPEKGRWCVGGLKGSSDLMMVDLWLLGLIPLDFWSKPLAGGASWWLWDHDYKKQGESGKWDDIYAKNVIANSNSPEEMRYSLLIGFSPIQPEDIQSFYLSNELTPKG